MTGYPMTTTERTTTVPTRTAARARSPLYSALVGLAAVAVLLQGLWAGLFIRGGQKYADSWVQYHSVGGEVAIGLAVLATIVALVKLRSRVDLVVGSIVFTLVLVLEAYLGGLIGDSPWVTAIHIPLAMALMGLAVWLPVRATRR